MAALFVIAVALLAVAVVLVVRAIALPRMRVATNLRRIQKYGLETPVGEEGVLLRPPGNPGINALAEGMGRFMLGSVPALKPISRQQLNSAAMYKMSVEALHGYRSLASLALPALVLIEALSSGTNAAVAILLAGVACAICWFLFGAVVRHKADSRLAAIDRELPELIDVLIATLEAGLGFAGALQLVASRVKDPLGAELRLALQEQAMGLSTNRALANILERSDTPAMRSFVRAVVQGETFGISIGMMMRNLAQEMRSRRRQSAQERVQQAPLKMLFPLIFLIFPAMLIVLLYPAVHELLQGFSNL